MLQDELLDVIYWWRQGLCIAMGILWGVVPLTGLMGFLS
jgi:EMC6